MRREDKAVLSTWLTYLDSLKMNPNRIEPPLEYAPQSSITITEIHENLYNSIMLAKPTNDLSLIDELYSLQRKYNLPLTAWITPATDSPYLEKMLQEQFKTPGAFYGMLLNLKQATVNPCPANITIEQINNSQQAEEFATVFSQVFNFPNLRKHTEQWVKKQYEMNQPSALNYIARVNGMLAGACSLMLDHVFHEFKTGGLYNACVLPDFRKSGVGTAMACHRVNIAKEQLGLEYLSIILMSDAMARGYCERLGFVNCGTLTPYFIVPRN